MGKRDKLTTLQREILVLLEDLGEMVLAPWSFWRKTAALPPPSTYRYAIHRLRKENAIEKVEKAGGIVLKMTDKGKDLLARAPRLADVYRKWDGKWRLVSFDFPEKTHRDRDYLRRKLKQLGFGRLHRSVWISPRNKLQKIKEIVDLHSYRGLVWTFEGRLTGGRISQELVSSVWPQLKMINREYQEFISRWKERLAEVRKKGRGKERKFEVLKRSLGRVAECELAEIITRDPCLPKELLPEDWAMGKAVRLFRQIDK